MGLVMSRSGLAETKYNEKWDKWSISHYKAITDKINNSRNGVIYHDHLLTLIEQ